VILIDSSVWINYFNGVLSPRTDKLDGLLRRRQLTLRQLASGTAAGHAARRSGPGEFERLAICDLILAEVLQGFADDRDFCAARAILLSFDVVELGGRKIAIQGRRTSGCYAKLGLRCARRLTR
jgi:hypothetical protein